MVEFIEKLLRRLRPRRPADHERYSTSDLTSSVVLTRVEKAFVVRAWKKIDNKDDFFITVWINSIARMPELRDVFGIARNAKDSEIKSNSRVVRVSRGVTEFFKRVIKVNKLSTVLLIEDCKSLGARHTKYYDNGFDVVYWDSFAICVEAELEKTLNTKLKHETVRKYIYSWRKLLRFVNKYMRDAYHLHETIPALPSS